jgi:hypothetical protein
MLYAKFETMTDKRATSHSCVLDRQGIGFGSRHILNVDKRPYICTKPGDQYKSGSRSSFKLRTGISAARVSGSPNCAPLSGSIHVRCHLELLLHRATATAHWKLCRLSMQSNALRMSILRAILYTLHIVLHRFEPSSLFPTPWLVKVFPTVVKLGHASHDMVKSVERYRLHDPAIEANLSVVFKVSLTGTQRRR